MDFLRNTLKDSHKKTSIASIYMLATIAVQFIFAYLFINGTASFYGRTVTASAALKLFTALFSNAASAYIYQKFFGAVLGVFYFVVLILIIKNIIMAIRTYKITHKDPKLDGNYYETTVFVVARRATSSFVSILTFMVCCSLVRDYDLNFSAILLIILGIITFASARILLFFLNRFDDNSIVMNTVYLAIFILTIGLILANANHHTLENLFDGFKALPATMSNTSALISTIAEFVASLANMILVFVALYVLHSANYYLFTEPHEVHGGARLIMIFSGITLGVALVAHILTGGGLGLKALLTLLIPYITLFFPTIALFLYTKFPVEVNVLGGTQNESIISEEDSESDAKKQ